MSNYKQLKSNPEYNISLVDVMSFVTKTNKAKYLELFCKLYKNKKIGGKKNNVYGTLISKIFDIPQSEVDMLTSFSTYIHYLITENMSEDIKLFQKFVNLNERGLIEKNDVLTYTSIDELKNEVSKSESRHIEKEMEKQVQKISDDEEWLVLRPLTYESSRKYGSNTKWCTTHNERTYFDKYTKNGILIYFINKKTGVKVAVFRSLKHSDSNSLGGVAREFSFWDQKDVRIDSMESGLPDYIKSILMEEINNNPYTNLEVYAKRNKVQVPKEEEFFKKRRTIGVTEMVVNEEEQEPGGDVLPGMLPDINYGELAHGVENDRFGRLAQRINDLTNNDRVRRVRELMTDDVEDRPVDQPQPTRLRVADLVDAIARRQEYIHNLEVDRIQEANEDVESEFISQMRQLEEQHQQEEYVDRDFISEMESREDEEEDYGVEAEPMPEDGEDMVGEIDGDVEESVNNFLTEMSDRLGRSGWITTNITIERPQLRDESQDEQAG